MMENAITDFFAQVDEFGDPVEDRYPGAQQRNFDGQPQLTEMDAIIAYMQMLGTLVDFETFVPSGQAAKGGKAWKPIPGCAPLPIAGICCSCSAFSSGCSSSSCAPARTRCMMTLRT
jgi:hypothetical protein